MQMKLCSRCKKRVAVIYVTKTENGQTTSEGLCLRCAKELGIKPMSDIIRKLGISEEEFDAMADEVAGMIPFVEPDDESDNEGRAPALDFNAIMGAIVKAKPAAAKGQYIKSCVVASTMGPGVKVNGAKLM